VEVTFFAHRFQLHLLYIYIYQIVAMNLTTLHELLHASSYELYSVTRFQLWTAFWFGNLHCPRFLVVRPFSPNRQIHVSWQAWWAISFLYLYYYYLKILPQIQFWFSDLHYMCNIYDMEPWSQHHFEYCTSNSTSSYRFCVCIDHIRPSRLHKAYKFPGWKGAGSLSSAYTNDWISQG